MARVLMPGVVLLLLCQPLEAQVSPAISGSPLVSSASAGASDETGGLLLLDERLWIETVPGDGSRTSLVAGGVLGGVVGYGLGLAVGIPRGWYTRCGLACIPEVFLILVLAESLGVAAGVHLADGRQGSLGRRALASSGIGLVGTGVALSAGGSPVLVLAVPAAQIWALVGGRVGSAP